MKVLSLFSGIGGLDLAAEWAGMQTVMFCEKDPKCQQVLRKHWPKVPIVEDVRNVSRINGIDIVCGGYPCQGESLAGKRKGKDDDRWLWPEMFRVVKEVRPAWVVGENVAGHISMGLATVCADLESAGYEVQPFVIPAAGVGARHVRDRCWVIAHTGCLNGDGWQDMWPSCDQQWQGHPDGPEAKHDVRRWLQTSWSANDPRIRGNGNGVPNRVDRLRMLGNAVVPQQTYPIFKAIKEISERTI